MSGVASAKARSRMVDVCVIGAGPAGLAAAAAAAGTGAEVVVLERERYAGGVLPQCVHDGFGLHIHGRSLTGPEYAAEWETRARDAGAQLLRGCTVLSVAAAADGGFAVDAVGEALGGRCQLRARAVVCATGCRERTRGQLGIPGTRPAGVLTAGAAQYMMNVANQLPGDKAVVLGSGDIGLIMARRLTLEGAEVRLVLGQAATGLLRNYVRCIDDFSIPLRFGWGVASIHGNGRLKGVCVAPMNEDGSFDEKRREYVRCNLLLIACGLIPEREVLAALPDADDDAALAKRGVFVCGNARAPHDLADSVTQEGLAAGLDAAAFAAGVAAGAGAGAGAAAAGAGAAGAGAAGAAEAAAEVRRILAVRVREPKGRMGDRRDAAPGTRCVPCTVCPTGCVVHVNEQGVATGQHCERGAAYALAELTEPMRLFTGTVRTRCAPGCGAEPSLLPVRTATEVPRERVRDVARACRRMRVSGPVHVGDVLHPNVAGTGVALLACAEKHTRSAAEAPAPAWFQADAAAADGARL